jgi:iron(III) transport system substrate-binding protein
MVGYNQPLHKAAGFLAEARGGIDPVAHEDPNNPPSQDERTVDRRALLRTVAGVLAWSAATPSLAMAQQASPEADPEPDPTADPEAGEGVTSSGGAFTLYSGRNETLVGPLIERYQQETGTAVDVRYGGTGELAATLLEEGHNTPASAFLAQDAGALGLLADEGRLAALPQKLLTRVDPKFRDPQGRWVGITGRARVLAYNANVLAEADLPASVNDLTDPVWARRIGWAPENASFQSFITAFRKLKGEDAARDWLERMIANGAVNFGDSNIAIVQAIASGEIDVGLVNHYYVYVVGREAGEDFPVKNHFFAAGDPGALINVSGFGLIEGAAAEAALAFADYLLSEEGQHYFAEQTFEYPLIAGVPAPAGLVPLDDLGHPDIDLGDLADLRSTLDLLTDVGLL